MKCNSCGANYRLIDNDCPYCGRPNTIGRFWNGEIKSSLESKDEAKENAAMRTPIVAYTKVINRVLILEIILLIIWGIIIAPRMLDKKENSDKNIKDAYVMFNEECMKLEDMKVIRKYDTNHVYNEVTDMITYASDILKENRDYVDVIGWTIHVPHGEEYKADVKKRLKYEFLLTDEEIEKIEKNKLNSNFLYDMFIRIKARNRWEYLDD